MNEQTPEWTTGPQARIAGRIAELVERAQAADGVAPISEQAVLSLTATDGHEGTSHLPVERDGELVAYANLVAAHGDHPAMAEAVVDPRARGRGIGATLVAAALSAGGPGTRIWAHGNLAPARAVAGRLGLSVVRELWQMRRPLAGDAATAELPPLLVPADLILRTYAGPADDAEILRVNNAAFDWHPEQGGWSGREIQARRSASWFDPKGLFIAVDRSEPGRILGFHWTKVHEPGEHGPDAVGEVYVVAVDPAVQGRGLGAILTLAGLHYLRDRGLPEVLLYTEADNAAAVRTYTRLGFATAHIDAAYATP
ncbi:MAG: mycothiol synthase [Nocardia sp.]|nr:mycothiol synthase [Nocardia sp.]